MKLRKPIQYALLIIMLGLIVLGFVLFIRMENGNNSIIEFLLLILDVPMIFLCNLILNSEYCTIIRDLEYKLEHFNSK